MRQLELVRLSTRVDKQPKAGFLKLNGEPYFATLEPPFNLFLDQFPCIPTGTYVCKKVYDRKTTGGLFIPITFEITNVPQRSGILFHIGNYAKDTRGCVLLGMQFGRLNDQISLVESRVAFEKFVKMTDKDKEFELKVIQV